MYKYGLTCVLILILSACRTTQRLSIDVRSAEDHTPVANAKIRPNYWVAETLLSGRDQPHESSAVTDARGHAELEVEVYDHFSVQITTRTGDKYYLPLARREESVDGRWQEAQTVQPSAKPLEVAVQVLD